MNASSIVRLMAAKNQFAGSHPKFMAFMKAVFSRPVKEGTIVEFTVTRPGEEPVTANMKVLASDLELLEELRELMRQ